MEVVTTRSPIPSMPRRARVQGLGGVQSEGDPPGILDAEEGSDLLTAIENNAGRFLGEAVAGAAGAPPDFAEKELHRLPHRLAAWEKMSPRYPCRSSALPGSWHVLSQRFAVTEQLKSGPSTASFN